MRCATESQQRRHSGQFKPLAASIAAIRRCRSDLQLNLPPSLTSACSYLSNDFSITHSARAELAPEDVKPPGLKRETIKLRANHAVRNVARLSGPAYLCG